MYVSGLETYPIHRGQMTHRLALVRMQHNFRFRSGSRGKIEQQRVCGPGNALWREGRAGSVGLAERGPTGCLVTHDDARTRLRERVKVRDVGGVGNNVAYRPAFDAVDCLRR